MTSSIEAKTAATAARREVLAIYVNFFKAARLQSSVHSLLERNHDVNMQVIIVDNSCCAKERSQLEVLANDPRVSCIFTESNLGYTTAVNIGVRSVNVERDILLVSPDVITCSDSIVSGLLDVLECHENIGIVAPLQHNDDGSVVDISRRFPTFAAQLRRRISSKRSDVELPRLIHEHVDGIVDADWVQSSFVLVRQAVWRDVGGLNTDYFLFMADTEFCLDAMRAGWRTVVAGRVSGLRADGIRASAGGPASMLFKRASRAHLKDAMTYYANQGWRYPASSSTLARKPSRE